jgi:hypothetical protein
LKGLAEFAMRGRSQALLVVLITASTLMFSWIAAAVLALVILRRGVESGAWLLFWALLPAGALLIAFGDSGPLMNLVGTAVLATVLRTTVSLPLTLVASAAVGVVTGLAMVTFGADALSQIEVLLTEFLGNLEQQLSSGREAVAAVVLHKPSALQIAGMLGLINAMGSTLCLLLARWWQAVLYNPGGFGEEFRTLLLPPAITLVLMVLAIGLFALGMDYRTWAGIFVVPLTFAGLALVHARAALRGQGSGWLTGFYLLWLFFDPVKLIVVFVAIADSWMDFRQRWSRRAGKRDIDKDDI